MLNILICSMNMSIVAVIYLIVSRILYNKQSPSIRYYSWLVVIAGFLIPIRPQTGSALVTIEKATPADLVVTNQAVHTETVQLIEPMSVITAIYLIGAASFIRVRFRRAYIVFHHVQKHRILWFYSPYSTLSSTFSDFLLTFCWRRNI